MMSPVGNVWTPVTAQVAPTRGTFEAHVLTVVRRIPRGRVATYGDIALLAGRPRAWRAVGTIMHKGDILIGIDSGTSVVKAVAFAAWACRAKFRRAAF